jgi:hypothetical protein
MRRLWYWKKLSPNNIIGGGAHGSSHGMRADIKSPEERKIQQLSEAAQKLPWSRYQ